MMSTLQDGKEERQVADDLLPGAGARVLAGQPVVEWGEVRDNLLLVGLQETIIEKLDKLEHRNTLAIRTFPVWFVFLVGNG